MHTAIYYTCFLSLLTTCRCSKACFVRTILFILLFKRRQLYAVINLGMGTASQKSFNVKQMASRKQRYKYKVFWLRYLPCWHLTAGCKCITATCFTIVSIRDFYSARENPATTFIIESELHPASGKFSRPEENHRSSLVHGRSCALMSYSVQCVTYAARRPLLLHTSHFTPSAACIHSRLMSYSHAHMLPHYCTCHIYSPGLLFSVRRIKL